MKKRDKKRLTKLNGGIGANVIDGDLNLALSTWKQDLKKFNVISELRNRKFFTKKSIKQRNIKKNAIFLRKKAENV